MLIGDLSKKVGVSKHTIRYYEEFGLIKVLKKERRDNNYKEYSNDILERIITINRLKVLGFTLVEIKEILDILIQENNPCSDILVSVNNKIEVIDQKINDLIKVRAKLLKINSNCNENCKMDDILPNCVPF